MDSLILSLPAECQSLKIDLRKLPKKEAVRLSDLGATDIQYIPLETTKQNVLPEIKKIVFGKSFFLTHSYANINMFRYNGQFVTKISKEGRGPDEITVAHDIDINPKDETIYLVDGWLQKFLVYNRDGKLMRSFKSPLKIAINFRITNDGILCYNDNNMAKTTDSFILIDTLGKVIMNYPNTYKWQDKTNRTVGYLHENLFYRFNDQIFKKEMYSDTVFVYRDKAFKPHIIIDVGKLRITPEARTNSPVAYIIHNFLTPHKLFECGDYIYYEFSYQPDDENEGFSVIASKGNNFKIFF
ncbi:MAG: 6-bladed beta-propeller [Bacteroidales bacterium]|nr:6-bladed beta-propeller [Bacteroidales bacterium]